MERNASMPQPNDRSALRDIQIQCGDIAEAVRGQDETSFLSDRMRTAAVERYLEVIGEATKRLSPTLRDAHPEVDWRGWAGLRDIVIHAYDQILQSEIWQVATVEAPVLASCVAGILQVLDSAAE